MLRHVRYSTLLPALIKYDIKFETISLCYNVLANSIQCIIQQLLLNECVYNYIYTTTTTNDILRNAYASIQSI